jgi:hypothetical protein
VYGVVLLHLGGDDRSFDRHVPLLNGDLAGGNAYANVQARAPGGGMGKGGGIGLVVDFFVDLTGRHQAAGDALFLGANGDPLIEALVHLTG